MRVLAEARAVNRRLRSLVRLNLELAKLEGKQKATALAIGVGLGVGAFVLVLYAVFFVFAAIAAALDQHLSLWVALLIVAGMILIVVAVLVFLAMRFVRKALPAKPSQAIEEGERTIATLKNHA